MTFPYDRERLNALVAEVDARLENVDKVSREASKVQLRSSGLSQADLAEINRAAHGPNAPRELRELARRVDSGEMSWQDIASGRAVNDPGVQAALATGVPDLQRAYTQLQEGNDPEDVVESGRPRRGGGDDDEPSSFTEDAW